MFNNINESCIQPPHSKRGPGFDPGSSGPSVWSLHVLPVAARLPFGFSDLLPQSKDTQLKFIDDFKMPVGENVCVKARLSPCVSAQGDLSSLSAEIGSSHCRPFLTCSSLGAGPIYKSAAPLVTCSPCRGLPNRSHRRSPTERIRGGEGQPGGQSVKQSLI